MGMRIERLFSLWMAAAFCAASLSVPSLAADTGGETEPGTLPQSLVVANESTVLTAGQSAPLALSVLYGDGSVKTAEEAGAADLGAQSDNPVVVDVVQSDGGLLLLAVGEGTGTVRAGCVVDGVPLTTQAVFTVVPAPPAALSALGDSDNCLQLGTATSLYSKATRPLTGAEAVTADEYYVSLDYLPGTQTYYYIWTAGAGPEVQQKDATTLQFNYGGKFYFADNVLTGGVWQHFVLFYSGSEFRIFVDGKPIQIHLSGSTELLDAIPLTAPVKIAQIGPIGDLSETGNNKAGYFDNIQIVQKQADGSLTATTSLDFNDGTSLSGQGWTFVTGTDPNGYAGYAAPAKNSPATALSSLSGTAARGFFLNEKLALDAAFSVAALLDDGTPAVVGMGKLDVSLSDPAAGTVTTENGKAYIQFTKAGSNTLNLTLTWPDGTQKTASAPFTVSAASVSVRELQITSADSVVASFDRTLALTAVYDDNSTKTVGLADDSGMTVTSGNTTAVSVEQTAGGFVLHGLAEGTSLITVSCTLDGKTLSATQTMTVTGPVKNSLRAGTATSLSSHARFPLPQAVLNAIAAADEYCVSFDYFAPDDKHATYYYMWRSYDGSKVNGPELQQIEKKIQLNYTGKTSVQSGDILQYNTWQTITLQYKGNEFRLYVNGEPVKLGDSYTFTMAGADKIAAVGHLGDTSSGGANGYALFDNIRIVADGAALFSESFDDGNGESGLYARLASRGWVLVPETAGDIDYTVPANNAPEPGTLASVSVANAVVELPVNSTITADRLLELAGLTGLLSDGKKAVLGMAKTELSSSNADAVEISGSDVSVKAGGESAVTVSCTLLGVAQSATFTVKAGAGVTFEGVGLAADTNTDLVIGQDATLGFVLAYSNGLSLPVEVKDIAGLSVVSSAPAVLRVNQQANSVTLSPLSEGSATVTVSYTLDGQPKSFDRGFTVRDKYYSALQNASFENGVDNQGKIKNWTPYTPSNKVELSTERAYEGQYSAKMITPAIGAGNGLRSDAVRVTEGQSYRAKGYFYNQSGSVDIYLEYWNASGTRLSVFTQPCSRTGSWNENSVTGIAPSGTAYATVLAYHSSATVGVTYVDAVSLEPYTEEEVVNHYTAVETQHPRLFFTASELPAIRAKTTDTRTDPSGISGKTSFDDLKALADTYLSATEIVCTYSDYNNYTVRYPLPPQQPGDIPNPPGYTGVFPFWTYYGRALEDRLEVLAMAYVGTGETQYADMAVRDMLSIAGWSAWADPKELGSNDHSCLGTTHIVMGVAAAYDLLYDYMTEEQRTTVRTALVDRGIEPLYLDAKAKTDHNIQMRRAAVLASSACSVIGEVDSALTDKWLSRATEYFNWYLDERMESGNQEGFGYTAYALEAFVSGVEHIARVTGDRSLLDHPYLNNYVVKWVAYCAAPGSGLHPAYSDMNLSTEFFATMHILNKWNHDGLAGWYLATAHPVGTQLLKFLYCDPDSVVTPPSGGDTSAVLEEIGYGALRTGWESDDTVLTMIANSSGLAHNHYDQNSFQIASNGVWVAGDPGYAYLGSDKPDLTTFELSVGHSTILVDGAGQTLKGMGALKEKLTFSKYSYMIGSAAGAYGTLLQKFDRHAILINHGQNPYYVLIDDLQADTARTFTWNLFAGAWNQLALNGTPTMSVENSATGASIAVEKVPTDLYVQFVSGTPLTLRSDYYKTSGQASIQAENTEKSQSAQYMAILNTAKMQGSVLYATTLADTAVTNNGAEIKTVTVNETPALFFRAAKTGDSVTLSFNVSTAGEYDVDLQFFQSTAYGQYQASVDGVPYGSVYEGYAATVDLAPVHSLGKLDLTAGTHTLTLTCVGKNAASANWFIGLVSLKLKGADEGEAFGTSKIKLLDSVDTDGALGAKVNYDADQYDIVLYNRTSAPMEAWDTAADAAQATVVGLRDGGLPEGIAVTDGKALSYGGRTWFTAARPVSAYLDYTASGGVTADVHADAQTTVSFLVNPENKSNLAVGGVKADGTGVSYAYDEATGLVTLTLDAGEHQVQASTYTKSSGGVVPGGGFTGGGSAGGAASPTVTLTGTKAADGAVTAGVTASQIGAALTAAKAGGGTPNVTIAVTAGDPSAVRVSIPREAVRQLADAGAGLTLTSPLASVTFDGAALAAVGGSAAGAVTVGVSKADASSLTPEQGEKVGERPVYDFTVTSGGTAISDFGEGRVTVGIPYTPGAGEDANQIVVYYLTDDGGLSVLTNGRYDAQSGMVFFTTDHFSRYAVGYNGVRFSDVGGWCEEYVNYLAARGVIQGVGSGKFGPDSDLTRGELATILANLSQDELGGYSESAFGDVQPDDWYFAAVQWANDKKIAQGYDGRFRPDAPVMREELAAMLYRFAQYEETELPESAESGAERFTDAASVSDWACPAVEWAARREILSGNPDGSLAPGGHATRAQAAKMIAVLLQSAA